MIDFYGEDMNGTWRLWIEDTYGDGGHQATGIDISFTYMVSQIEWLGVGSASGIIAPGDCIDIGIMFNASELEAGMHEGMLMVASNDPDYPEVEIPVHFEVTELGQLTTSPDTLWFLDEQSCWEGKTATIHNSSNVDVTISEIQESGYDPFMWYVSEMSQTLPHTLMPSEEMTFVVYIDFPIGEGFVTMAYDSVPITSDAGVYYQTIAVDLDVIPGMDENIKRIVNIYPSPFTNMLTIDLNNFDEAIEKVIVTDLNGRIVKSFNAESLLNNTLTWNTGEAAGKIDAGVYLVQIIAGNKTEVFKVIKMK